MNFPSLPQGFNHLMVALLLFFLYFNYSNVRSDSNSLNTRTQNFLDSSDLFQLKVDSLTTTTELQNLDSQLTKIETLMKDTSLRKQINHDSLHKVLLSMPHEFDNAKSKKYRAINKLETYRIQIDYINSEIKAVRKETYFAMGLSVFFCILIFYYLANIYIENKLIADGSKMELYKYRIYKNCQSCGKVFSPMLLHGKNKDGITNEGFCIECFNNGEFLNSELTKQDIIDEIMKAKGLKVNSKKIKSIEIKKIQIMVNQMVRWNKNPYIDNYKF